MDETKESLKRSFEFWKNVMHYPTRLEMGNIQLLHVAKSRELHFNSVNKAYLYKI